MTKESDLVRNIKKTLPKYSKKLGFQKGSLVSSGMILWGARLNSGKIQTQYGSWFEGLPKSTPDFVVLVKAKTGGAALIFFECKKPGETLREEQQYFFDLFNDGLYIYCFEITKIEEFYKHISNIAICPVDEIDIKGVI